MSVYVNNLTINIGADFTETYELYNMGDEEVDLTGYTAIASLRKHAGSSNSVNFTVSFLDRKNGIIKLFIPSWITSKLKSGRYVYDVLLYVPKEIQDSIKLPFTVQAAGIYSNNITFTSEFNNFSFSSNETGIVSKTIYYNTDYILSTSGNGPGTQALKIESNGFKLGLDDMQGAGADGDFNDLTIETTNGTFFKDGNTFKFRYSAPSSTIKTKKQIIVEGMIYARGGISSGCSFSLPTSAQRLCIAVIDENSDTSSSGMETLWGQFRSTYPNRTFYLLQPTTVGFGARVNNTNYSDLACPNNFLNETTVNVPPLI